MQSPSPNLSPNPLPAIEAGVPCPRADSIDSLIIMATNLFHLHDWSGCVDTDWLELRAGFVGLWLFMMVGDLIYLHGWSDCIDVSRLDLRAGSLDLLPCY
jgi:hypothetical protein